MAIIGLEISILLFAAFLGYFLSVRIGQSAVIGEILIGVLIGPSVFGLITYSDLVSILAQMGAIFLLFAIGLECKFKEIYNAKNAFIAFFGVVVPFILGFLMTRAFGYANMESVFVGTALTATSIAITANVLKEMGKLNTHTAKIIIGAAVIDDILGLLVLSVALGQGTGNFKLLNVLIKIAVAVLFLAGTVIIMPYINRFMNYVGKWARKTKHIQLPLILSIAVAFAYSTISELVGLSAIVGAFLAGITLEGLFMESYKEGTKYLEMVFSAIFFVSLGVLVNLKEIGGIGWFFVVLLIVAIISKIIGCFIPALLAGERLWNSLIIGVGMIPRGEFVMVVALYGLTHNIIGQGIYASILLMALLTTIILPVILKTLYSNAERFK